MAPRRTSALLPAVLAAAAACALVARAFVPAGNPRAASVALRAIKQSDEVEVGRLPAPDGSLMTAQSKVGQTVDQDKRGNMWAQTDPIRRSDEEQGEFDVLIQFFALVVLMIGSIIFLAVWQGNDSRFGGVIGDGAESVGI